MSGSAAFCPQCGAKRLGNYRFCTTCKFDYDAMAGGQAPATHAAPAPAPSPTAASPSGSSPVVLLAGVSWIACAALTGYLAILQLSYAGSFVDDGTLTEAAIWNGGAAALTLFFGAKLLTSPSRGFLGTSVAVAALVLVWNIYSVLNGVTHWAYIGATVAALAAGVLSFAARSAWPSPGPARMEWGSATKPPDAP